nr:MAG TPA: hypothetical protein [Caudoviricetes sp.]
MVNDLLALLMALLLCYVVLHLESVVNSNRQFVADFSVLLLSCSLAIHGNSTNLRQSLLELDWLAERQKILAPQEEVTILQLSSVLCQMQELSDLRVSFYVSFHIIKKNEC